MDVNTSITKRTVRKIAKKELYVNSMHFSHAITVYDLIFMKIYALNIILLYPEAHYYTVYKVNFRNPSKGDNNYTCSVPPTELFLIVLNNKKWTTPIKKVKSWPIKAYTLTYTKISQGSHSSSDIINHQRMDYLHGLLGWIYTQLWREQFGQNLQRSIIFSVPVDETSDAVDT